MPVDLGKALKLFYSYADDDERLSTVLQRHMTSLRMQGVIDEWHKLKISAGSERETTTEAYLNSADVILLLVSANFLASDYCSSIEMQRALTRHKAGEALVIPILLRPVELAGSPLEALIPLPANAKAVTTWHNRDEAFLQITVGIRKAIEGLQEQRLAGKVSDRSRPSSSNAPWSIPYRRNLYFTGQDHILTLIRDRLGTGSATALTQAIHGLGGIGKTQIAIEYAYQYRDEYLAVLWVNASSRESLLLSFANLAKLLHLPEREVSTQEHLVVAMYQWLSTHHDWLLIFDNADDLTVIDDCLPADNVRGHILLTTRSQALGTTMQGIVVNTLEITEGILLLLRRAKLLPLEASLEHISPTDRESATKIVQAFGGLPLALDQAGAYIEETGCDLVSYLERYQTHRTYLLKRRGRFGTDHPESVATTWSLSFGQVRQSCPAAADVLHLCAFMYPDTIPEELLTRAANDLSPQLRMLSNLVVFDETLEALRAYSLIRRDAGTRTISLHRLVQVVLQDAMSEDLQRYWATCTIQVVERLFPDAQDFGAWSDCQRYILQAQACAETIARWNLASEYAVYLLKRAGMYLYTQAQYVDARQLLERLVTICEQVFGSNHLYFANSLNALAELYTTLEMYKQAEPLYQRVIAIQEQSPTPDYDGVVGALNNLANFHGRQGQYEQAKAYFVRAITLGEQKLGHNDPTVVHVQSNLATFYRVQKQYELAVPITERVLEYRRHVLGPNHPDTAQSLNDLAMLYDNLGLYEQAEPLYVNSLAIFEQSFGPDHPLVAMCLSNLAEMYQILGRYEHVEAMYRRALTISERSHGPDHHGGAETLGLLGVFYRVQQKYEASKTCFLQVLGIYQRIEQTEAVCYGVSACRAELALVYLLEDKVEEAESLYQQLFPNWGISKNYVRMASILNNLGLSFHRKKDYIQAKQFYQLALSFIEKYLGPKDYPMGVCLNNLAWLFHTQGDFQQADPLYQRALFILFQTAGQNDHITIMCLENYQDLVQKLKLDGEIS